jgi:hypothetical protein
VVLLLVLMLTLLRFVLLLVSMLTLLRLAVMRLVLLLLIVSGLLVVADGVGMGSAVGANGLGFSFHSCLDMWCSIVVFQLLIIYILPIMSFKTMVLACTHYFLGCPKNLNGIGDQNKHIIQQWEGDCVFCLCCDYDHMSHHKRFAVCVNNSGLQDVLFLVFSVAILFIV